MRRIVAAGIALLLLFAASPSTTARSPIPFDEETDCLEALPAAANPGLDKRAVRLDVHVLLDGASLTDGIRAVADARRAYGPLGIDLRATYGTVRIPADGRARGYDGKPYFTASTDRAMRAAKYAVGGRPPAGAELVYLLTNKDLYLGEDAPDDGGRSYAVAGMADCIGGILLPHRAFAVGERLAAGGSIGPLAVAQRLPGKILAHELGHLLGAHHHYANCAEAVPHAAAERTTDVCTLMFNDVSLVSLRYSTANLAVVRGHALAATRR